MIKAGRMGVGALMPHVCGGEPGWRPTSMDWPPHRETSLITHFFFFVTTSTCGTSIEYGIQYSANLRVVG